MAGFPNQGLAPGAATPLSPLLRARSAPVRKTTTVIASSLNPFNGSFPSWLSGSMTGGSWKDLASVSGAGVLLFAALGAQDATPRTVDLEIVLDDVVRYTGSEAISSARWFVGCGCVLLNGSGAPISASYGWMPFYRSMILRARQTDTASNTLRLDADWEVAT